MSITECVYQEGTEAKAPASREKKRNKINPKQAEGRTNKVLPSNEGTNEVKNIKIEKRKTNIIFETNKFL